MNLHVGRYPAYCHSFPPLMAVSCSKTSAGVVLSMNPVYVWEKLTPYTRTIICVINTYNSISKLVSKDRILVNKKAENPCILL